MKNMFEKESGLQKSKILLYPLVGYSYGAKYTPTETYLWWEEFGIDNFELIVYYKEMDKAFENMLLQSKYLISCFELEEGMIYIYDLISFADDVYHFLEGEYSQYSDTSKKTIMKYFGANEFPKAPDTKLSVAAALFPWLYYDIFREEYLLDDSVKLTELFSKYNEEAEKCTLKSVKDSCCKPIEIKSIDLV